MLLSRSAQAYVSLVLAAAAAAGCGSSEEPTSPGNGAGGLGGTAGSSGGSAGGGGTAGTAAGGSGGSAATGGSCGALGCVTTNVQLLASNAIHADYSQSGDELLIDALGSDAFYDVIRIDSAGQVLSQLTHQQPGIYQRHNGWPAWHPKQSHVVFQSEEPQHYLDSVKSLGMPGLGLFNNLWAVKLDGTAPTQLTNIPIKQTQFDGLEVHATVHPVFSHDGSKLMWTERYTGGETNDWGAWQVHIADFSIDASGMASLGATDVLVRGKDICADCNYVIGMGFSPDDKEVLLAGNLGGQHPYGMDLYRFSRQDKKLVPLLDSPLSWEEGSCWSPDGQAIVYMSNKDSPYTLDFSKDWTTQTVTRELYVMRADGTDSQRLTGFNTPGTPEYAAFGKGKPITVGKCVFRPDGKQIVTLVTVDAQIHLVKIDLLLN